MTLTETAHLLTKTQTKRLSQRPNLLHLSRTQLARNTWNPVFLQALSETYDITFIENADERGESEILSLVRQHRVLLSSHGSYALPESLADAPGALEYICHVNGSIKGFVPRCFLERGFVVTNWGDVKAPAVAEGALTLLLACLKNIRPHIEIKRKGGWAEPSIERNCGSLSDLRVGIYGFGAIARAFFRFLEPFGSTVLVYDRYANDLPKGTERVDSLRELFANSDAVVIHAGLTEETAGSVDKTLLSLLPDQGILINTARGAIVNHDHLFAELATGRLRAGLDVLDVEGNDWMGGHPATQYPNLILTAHRAGLANWPPRERLNPAQQLCLENLENFFLGRPVRFRVTTAQYDIMT